MTQFNGKHFGGRLFAGRLFRAPRADLPTVIPYGSGRLITPERKKRRRDRDDDVLLFLLR